MPGVGMPHPKDRSGLTRRQLLQGAAGSALAIGGVGALAGCENTTTPIGGGGGVNSKFVQARPLGPGGLPLPRPDYAITWAITPTTSRSRTAVRRRKARCASTTTPTTSGPAS